MIEEGLVQKVDKQVDILKKGLSTLFVVLKVTAISSLIVPLSLFIVHKNSISVSQFFMKGYRM